MATVERVGRVTNLKHIRGLVEYRFVQRGWTAPLPHLVWFEFDPIQHADEYQKWRNDILARADRLRRWNGREWDFTGSWFRNGQPFYTTRIDYHPVERPILVAIGGFTVATSHK